MSTADGRKNVCPERRRPNRTRTKRLGSDLLRNGSDWRKRSATIALPSKRNNLSPKEKHKTAAIAAGNLDARWRLARCRLGHKRKTTNKKAQEPHFRGPLALWLLGPRGATNVAGVAGVAFAALLKPAARQVEQVEPVGVTALSR